MGRFSIHARSVFAVAAGLGLLAALLAALPARAASRAPAWQAAGVTSLPGGLQAVSADSPTDAWAVGYSEDFQTGTKSTLALHWNGTAWSKVATPNPGSGGFDMLFGVSADSATDAWAVGFYCPTSTCAMYKSLILHWNGRAWAKVTSPDPGTPYNETTGVSADSATDAWTVGSYLAQGNGDTLAAHWTGTAWTQVTTPNPGPGPGAGNSLSAVSADSPSDAWAGGGYCPANSCATQDTLMLHWNGSTWAQVASPNPGTSGYDVVTGVSALSPADAWAAGNEGIATGTATLILHWNGTAWARVATPNPGPASGKNDQLDAISADSAGDAWATGYRCASGCRTSGEIDDSLILHWNGTAWAKATAPTQAGALSDTLNGVSADSPTDAWAVGTACTAQQCTTANTVILHWNGTAWSKS